MWIDFLSVGSKAEKEPGRNNLEQKSKKKRDTKVRLMWHFNTT